jgi:hypothetical protein
MRRAWVERRLLQLGGVRRRHLRVAAMTYVDRNPVRAGIANVSSKKQARKR